jgi:dipeptidyl aminopeptidase/acylaminoacyl peptidase
MRRFLVCSLLFSSALFGARFSLEQSGKMVRVSDPQISPDAKSIAVLVAQSNFEDNRYDWDLVLIDVSTKAQRILSHQRRGLAQPRWSPDGSSLGFLATASDNKPQAFIMPMNGGESWQATKSQTGLQQFAWSPDGKQLAYVALDEPAKVIGEERNNKVFEIRNNHYLIQEQQRPSHLWVTAVEPNAAPRRLTSGEWTLPMSLPPSSPSSPISWTPDGKSIVIAKVTTPYTGDSDRSAIALVTVADASVHPVTGRTKSESQPVVSPDGRRLAHWHPRDGDPKNVNEIYVGPVTGGQSASVTRSLDRNVQRALWMPDSENLLVSANDGTGVSLWVQPLDGKPKRIDLGNIVPTASFWLDASMGPHGELVFTGSEPTHPSEVYFLSTPTSAPVRLTGYNDSVASLELGRSETTHWKNEKFECDGVVTYPPDFQPNKKWPLVLYIHGGPRSASRQSFSVFAQLLSAQGWVVFEPNYRGSDNLGNDFQAAIWNDAGAGPGRDVMAGLKELEKRGFIDEKNIGVSGWSYGGYMTTWLLGNYPSVWKAGLAGAAVTDWMDQYNLGDANVRRGQAFGGSPYTGEKHMAEYDVQSPIHYATKITAPTLILSNVGDYRVPITQSYRLYHVLKDRGVTTQFFAYPLSGHSPNDPVHTRDMYRRWVDWMKKYLG